MTQQLIPGTVDERAVRVEEARKALAEAESAIKAASKLMREIASKIADAAADRIDGGLNLPSGIAPLAEAYREARREYLAATQDAGDAARRLAEEAGR